MCAVVEIWETGEGVRFKNEETSFRKVFTLEGGRFVPWSQKRPPQPSWQLHCHGSSQVPCLQAGYFLHSSQKVPCQPSLHLQQEGKRWLNLSHGYCKCQKRCLSG